MSGKYAAIFLRNYLIFVLKPCFDAALNYLGSFEQVNDNTFQLHLKTKRFKFVKAHDDKKKDMGINYVHICRDSFK